MNKKLKIATLIISSNTYPAIRNSKTQKKLFFEQNFDRDLTFWYKSGKKSELKNKEFKLKDNFLLINTDDSSINMGLKTILAFEWLLENREFEFLIRPTPSSYINFLNMQTFIMENLTNIEYVYSGKIQSTNDKYKNKINFVSGSTLILNKKTVQLIVDNKHEWDHDYWDDVALYILLNKLGITYQEGDRFDVAGSPFIQQIPTNFYQYRCRADNHYNYPRFLESLTLINVHKLVTGKKMNPATIFINKFYYWVSKKLYIYQFGWKVYLNLRKILKIILPSFLYNLIKNKFIGNITDFKHKRFKT